MGGCVSRWVYVWVNFIFTTERTTRPRTDGLV